jgi:uncharacterized membrane protein
MFKTPRMNGIRFPWLKKLKPLYKVLFCTLLAIISFVLVSLSDVDLLTRIMIGWNTFSFIMLFLDWIVFFNTQSKEIRTQAQVEDNSRIVIFGIVLVSTMASLLAVTLLLISSEETNKALRIISAITGMTFSWLLVHTIFAVRYAHLYYGDHETNENMPAGGIDFPNDTAKDHPDFIDFAYFSFVLGMTFQVSDVQVTSQRFRRLVLMHSLVSFVYNTVIVALTINTVAGLSDR